MPKSFKFKIILLLFLVLLFVGYGSNLKKEKLSNEINLTPVETENLITFEDNSGEVSELNSNYEPVEIENEDKKVAKDTTEEITKEPVYTCQTPIKEYLNMKFTYIGQYIGLYDNTYVPKNLEPLGEELATTASICMEREAKEAFRNMKNAAKTENIYIKVTSGYRSYERQKAILEARINSGPSDAYKFVAKPGHSEHQLGTTADISGGSIGYNSANASFDGTIEDKWLRENAYKYGFVMSYPEGKEDITGYSYEPWHYRYLGIENATYIHENGLTITEFLQ